MKEPVKATAAFRGELWELIEAYATIDKCSRTQVISKALSVYFDLREMNSKGADILIRSPDDKYHKLIFD